VSDLDGNSVQIGEARFLAHLKWPAKCQGPTLQNRVVFVFCVVEVQSFKLENGIYFEL